MEKRALQAPKTKACGEQKKQESTQDQLLGELPGVMCSGEKVRSTGERPMCI